MLEDTNLFSLRGGEFYITERKKDAFRIREGTVLVYIVPVKKEGPGRRSFLCEASKGEVIPSFVYQDAEYCNWRFCLMALEEAQIELIENGTTRILQERFARKAKIKNYRMEGYEGGLVDWYRINIVTEDGLIFRNQKEQEDTAEQVNRLVDGALQKRSPTGKETEQTTAAQKAVYEFCWSRMKKGKAFFFACMAIVEVLQGLAVPVFVANVCEEYVSMQEKAALFHGLGILAAVLIVRGVVSVINKFAVDRMAADTADEVQLMVYNRLFTMPEPFVRRYESANLTQRVMSAGKVIGITSRTLLEAAAAMLGIFLCLLCMVLYSGKPGGVSLVLGILYFIGGYRLLCTAMNYQDEAVAPGNKAYSLLFQFLSGVAGIRASGMENRAVYEYMKPFIRKTEAEENYRRFVMVGNLWYYLVGSIGILCICCIGVKPDRVGTLLAVCLIFGYFMTKVHRLVTGLVQLKGMRGAIENVLPVLKKLQDVEKKAAGILEEVSGRIEVANVTFFYEGEPVPALENVQLTIEPGEFVGIVGPSGCGKSTLLRLLLGFEKPSRGTIFYDGKDLECLNKQELHRRMGVVLQDDKLIYGNIYENVTITVPEASPEAVERVLHLVGMETDSQKLPMGVYTILNEDSRIISDGQRQQILLARAMLGEPDLLFLDEATSALDNITQRKVCEALEKMSMTRIVIAHRLSTVKQCDRIIVMEDGKIAEQGTYEELMSNCGLFWQLAERQLV